MNFMLDTDCCIYLMNGSHAKLTDRVLSHPPAKFAISIISVAELKFGVAKSARRKENEAKLATFRSTYSTVVFDDGAADNYGQVRFELQQRGTLIGTLDMLVAAHALALDVTLVTSNVREFRRVRGLRCESWAA